MSVTCPNCQYSCARLARFCGRCGGSLNEAALLRSATRATPLLTKWRTLSRKMTRKDVRKLLGEPLRVEMPANHTIDSQECWMYEYEVVGMSGAHLRGVVRLCQNDGRLLSWMEPNWSALGEHEARLTVAEKE